MPQAQPLHLSRVLLRQQRLQMVTELGADNQRPVVGPGRGEVPASQRRHDPRRVLEAERERVVDGHLVKQAGADQESALRFGQPGQDVRGEVVAEPERRIGGRAVGEQHPRHPAAGNAQRLRRVRGRPAGQPGRLRGLLEVEDELRAGQLGDSAQLAGRAGVERQGGPGNEDDPDVRRGIAGERRQDRERLLTVDDPLGVVADQHQSGAVEALRQQAGRLPDQDPGRQRIGRHRRSPRARAASPPPRYRAAGARRPIRCRRATATPPAGRGPAGPSRRRWSCPTRRRRRRRARCRAVGATESGWSPGLARPCGRREPAAPASCG